ncbi:collagen alpha-4(VI) chain-like [Mya arenaria]|uniref:collagen alpha-4(VI) chain-like n=1 Tax=Mya arenaria TaxID=6604 RepID=UPI0022E910E6|nr:collagen alpha-4(VI) chain-like [Mya arenaria]
MDVLLVMMLFLKFFLINNGDCTKADVVFVLDIPENMGYSNFYLGINSIGKFADTISGSSSDVQIGVYVYSSNFIAIPFTYSKDVGINDALNSLSYPAGRYSSQDSFRNTIDWMLTLSQGKRFDASTYVFLLTKKDTGRFTNDIAWFMDKGVSVTWVVVGSSVANPGSYIYLPAIQDAQAIAQALTNTVLAGQSFSEADVVFLVDGSNSMEPDGFHASMKFLSTFADKVKVGPSNTQVALIVYTDYIIRCLLFSWNFDSETFKQTVSSISLPGGSTDHVRALTLVGTTVLKLSNAKRMNA